MSRVYEVTVRVVDPGQHPAQHGGSDQPTQDIERHFTEDEIEELLTIEKHGLTSEVVGIKEIAHNRDILKLTKHVFVATPNNGKCSSCGKAKSDTIHKWL